MKIQAGNKSDGRRRMSWFDSVSLNREKTAISDMERIYLKLDLCIYCEIRFVLRREKRP